MSFIAAVLTFLLLVNCIVLVLLILIQLPKKDAGAGLAFGGGAADTLFGAGSGNALTKITKWAAGIFLGLALVLGLLQVKLHRGNASEFEQNVEEQQRVQTQLPNPQPSLPPAASPSAPASSSAAPPSSAPALTLISTNALAPVGTNGK